MIGENTTHTQSHTYIYIYRSYKLDLCRSRTINSQKNLEFLRWRSQKKCQFHQPDGPSNLKLWGLAIYGLSGFNWRQPFCGMDGNCLGKIQLSSTTHYHRTNTFIHGYGLDVPVQEMEGTTSFRPLFSWRSLPNQDFSTKHHGVKTSLFSLWSSQGQRDQ